MAVSVSKALHIYQSVQVLPSTLKLWLKFKKVTFWQVTKHIRTTMVMYYGFNYSVRLYKQVDVCCLIAQTVNEKVFSAVFRVF